MHLLGLGELVAALAERRPGIGVVFGIAGMVLSLALTGIGVREHRRLSDLRLEDVPLAECSLGDGLGVRWVRLHDGRPRCDLADVTEHDWPTRWIFGRASQVLVPVEDESGRMPVVLQFDHDVDCAALTWPQQGLLGNERATRGLLTPALLGRIPAQEPAVLAVGDSPRTPRRDIAGGVVLLVALGWMTLHFARKSQQRRVVMAHRTVR